MKGWKWSVSAAPQDVLVLVCKTNGLVHVYMYMEGSSLGSLIWPTLRKNI